MTGSRSKNKITCTAKRMIIMMFLLVCLAATYIEPAFAANGKTLEIPVSHSIAVEPASAELPEYILDQTFTFRLERLTTGAPMPDGAKGNTADISIICEGVGKFTGIKCIEPGRYEYKLYEVAGDRTRVSYDQRVYTVVITVPTSGEPSMVIKHPNGNKPDDASFTDVIVGDYEGELLADPPNLEFPAYGGLQKEINGSGKFRNTTFTFTAVPDDNAQALGWDKTMTITLDGEGSIMFDEITLTRSGTYTFIISEKRTHPGSWKYDANKYKYSFTIKQEETSAGEVYSVVSDPSIVRVGDDEEKNIETIVFKNTPSASNKLRSVIDTGDPTQFMVLVVMFVAAALVLSFILAPARRRK